MNRFYRDPYLDDDFSDLDKVQDTTPKRSKIDDWYWYTGRSSRTGFVPTKKSKFGWEKSAVSSGKSYSSYFWRPSVNKDKGQLITRAYNLAKEMVLVMNTPSKVNIRILSGDCSDAPGFTDGQTVHVSSAVFDQLSDETEAVDVFCGLTIHEGCHLLYTKLNDFKRWIVEHEKSGTKDLSLRKYIFNVIEDERVETELGKEKPGLSVFLEKSKKFYLSSSEAEKLKHSGSSDKFEKIKKIVGTLFQIIRYPKDVTPEDIDVSYEFFDRVQEYLVPLPENTKETTKAADQICDLLLVMFSEEMHDLEEKLEADKLRKSEAIKELIEDILGDPKLSELIKKILGASLKVGKDCKEGYRGDFFSSSLSSSEVSEAVKANHGILGKILEGFYEPGQDKDTVFIKSEDGWGSSSEKETYIQDREVIKEYIPSIKKILSSNNKDYTGILHGCKSGTLDTSKLAEAYQGVEHVYFRNYQVKTKKTSVCIVIDESGSMCYGDRETRARQAAILLNEAFKDLPGVNLYIYGHSADEKTMYDDVSTDIYVYREPGQKKEYALGNSHARLENRDGTALREIAKRVRKFDNNEVLMFILSDGSPSARRYRGGDAEEDTKKAVQEIEKQRFIPIQISISAYHDPSSMFKNYIMIEDLRTLAPELGKLVKKAVLKAGITDITL